MLLNKCSISHFTQSLFLHYLGKTEPTKYCFLPNAVLLFNLNNSQKHILLTLLTLWLIFHPTVSFLRAKAAMLSARLSHRNSVRPSVCLSVCLSVRLSVTRVDQAKTVQARISKSSPSAAWKTLVSGTVKLFLKFEGGHPERGR